MSYYRSRAYRESEDLVPETCPGVDKATDEAKEAIEELALRFKREASEPLRRALVHAIEERDEARDELEEARERITELKGRIADLEREALLANPLTPTHC